MIWMLISISSRSRQVMQFLYEHQLHDATLQGSSSIIPIIRSKQLGDIAKRNVGGKHGKDFTPIHT